MNNQVILGPGACWLPGFAQAQMDAVWTALQAITTTSPPRQVFTPGGRPFSVRLTNCGDLGWVSDRRGYRYEPMDPLTGQPWPAIPPAFIALAQAAAAAGGYDHFLPDACLINCYAVGARMSLHQDRDEVDFSQPIVSVSLGLPAVFQWGGAARSDPVQRIPLQSGDVVVWGGPSRLFFHGIQPVKPGHHPRTGETRWNLTFRRAG